MKFLLAETTAQDIERWAVAHLAPDPHAEPALGNAYRVSSLYFDTPRLDVYHRIPPHQRRKLRLRQYGASPTLFLEQKTRRGDRVRKRRTPISMTELHRLSDSEADPDWTGAWFQQRRLDGDLRPMLQVGCVRSAYVGGVATAPLRLTLDRHLCTVANSDCRPVAWQDPIMTRAHSGINGQAVDGSLQPEPLALTLAAACSPLLAEEVVLELKYLEAMPALFKNLLEEFALVPYPVSKYRLGVRVINPVAKLARIS